ncbi:MAG TPA: hypothetical protein VKQ54_09665 [Caulobacteraceae bacterium]|nr:hypothetical protein [Caulobacteraceae bacterium]
MRDAKRISRRALLGGAALSVGAAATIMASRSAAAQQKVSHADAQYQYQPRGQQRCEICLNFQPPSVCGFVVSPISPKGWCQFFAAKENAH